jgi:two-component system sensor histidine kinase BaeS
MFRRLDVRVIFIVAVMLLVAVGLTLFVVWWIDVNTVSVVTTDGEGTALTVVEESPSVAQVLAATWPLLLVGITAIILMIVIPLTIRSLRPIREVVQGAEALASHSAGDRDSLAPVDDVRSLSQSFQTIAAKLAHTDRLRRNMVNDIAHELRSPLSNLQAQLEALQDGLAQPDAEMIESLYEETMLLKRLTDDLHELALAEAGHLPLSFESISIEDLTHTAVQSMKPQIAGANLNVEISALGDLPAVEVDGKRMQQVLRNLLSNAIQHTPSGGKIRVSAELASDQILIRVEDSGEGLPHDALEDVFERFYRVDPSRARRTGGAGLGLAIVKQIVQAHHGRVWAENTPVQGALFTISLPVSQAAP